jgi:hypothetical protein
METEINFSYGDLRIDKVVKEFYQNIIEKSSVCIRAIAGCRKREVSFHRLIKNKKFSEIKMIKEAVQQSQQNSKNSKHILCIQDTTELKFDVENGRVREGLGPLTHSFCKGFFLHPGLLVDANDYSILGLSGAVHFVREEKIFLKNEDKNQKKNSDYKKFPIEDKVSMRWIEIAEQCKQNFSKDKKLTIIADRESDIYEEWDRIPVNNVNLITRASRDRNISGNGKLYNELEKIKPSFCYTIDLSEITGKRKKRTAKVEVSYSSFEIIRPKNCTDKKAKKSIILNGILVKEVTEGVAEKDLILWRLLTTHCVSNVVDAIQIINWYSKRWLIEQLFRTLKTQGINVEDSQLENFDSLVKISIAGLISATKILQLVQARDGQNNRKISDVFQKEDLEILNNLNKKLEGKTEKQKNPHKEKSLAWGSWIIARLGGWMGYSCERPPGPITMKRGFNYFQKIKVGWMLSKDVCIP